MKTTGHVMFVQDLFLKLVNNLEDSEIFEIITMHNLQIKTLWLCFWSSIASLLLLEFHNSRVFRWDILSLGVPRLALRFVPRRGYILKCSIFSLWQVYINKDPKQQEKCRKRQEGEVIQFFLEKKTEKKLFNL